MATAATDGEAGEITLQSLQLYHHKDGTPYMLGAGTFGMVRVMYRTVIMSCNIV